MLAISERKNYCMPAKFELPVNVAPWKIDYNRAILLIHDMQYYFLKKLESENLRSSLVDNIAAIQYHCRHHYVPIAYTAQSGDMTSQQRGLLKDFWGPGMRATPDERSITNRIKPNKEDWLFTKWRYSAFYQSNLLEKMRSAGKDQLIICGVYAHIGILATAIEAFSNNIETFIVADAIADFTRADHLMALGYAAKCCAVNIMSKEVLI